MQPATKRDGFWSQRAGDSEPGGGAAVGEVIEEFGMKPKSDSVVRLSNGED